MYMCKRIYVQCVYIHLRMWVMCVLMVFGSSGGTDCDGCVEGVLVRNVVS